MTSDPDLSGQTVAADPALARYLAAHAAPAACADALIRDHQGRILLVDPVYKDGWDLPGGMLEDEEPDLALRRELREELALDVEVGRLLALDTIPAQIWGRTILSLVYAAHPVGAVDAHALVVQASELREARFVTEEEAFELLAPAVARRLREAVGAERGSHTAVLRDGHRQPMSKRDYLVQLPAPMTAATVLVRDAEGRVLVVEPSYKDHNELVGGMVEAMESPAEAAARELAEELGLTAEVGRLLVVDTPPAAASPYGRAVMCFVFDTAPLTRDQAASLRFADGEVRAAHWMEPKQAAAHLPWPLADRLTAALQALADGTVIHLSSTPPTAGHTA
ncbi:NUDIX domain-containing protein [Kitasatospora hibisci]|uniref:NUDIX domain-containing protein n=1 Tax=Kitasatospora hibisci TaxID=3369522 RepID=UPI0037545E5C